MYNLEKIMKKMDIKKRIISIIFSTIFTLVLCYFFKWYLSIKLDSIFKLGVNIILCSLFTLIVDMRVEKLKQVKGKKQILMMLFSAIIMLVILICNLIPCIQFFSITNIIGFLIFVVVLAFLIFYLWANAEKNNKNKDSNNTEDKGEVVDGDLDKQNKRMKKVGKSKNLEKIEIVKNNLRKTINESINFIMDYWYIFKRVTLAIIGSTGLIGIIVIFYGANFDKFQNYLRKVLLIQIKTDKNSEQLIILIMALFLIFCPLVITIVEYIGQKKMKDNSATKYKNIYQIVASAANVGMFLITISLIVGWAEAKEITVAMVLIMWGILTVINMDIIWLVTLVRDWVAKDKQEHDSLPRTALIFGVITALISVIFK